MKTKVEEEDRFVEKENESELNPASMVQFSFTNHYFKIFISIVRTQ